MKKKRNEEMSTYEREMQDPKFRAAFEQEYHFWLFFGALLLHTVYLKLGLDLGNLLLLII